ncbi:DNA cytosine methyltransferase [Streptomyces griseocarneus]|uniref:DNA cytosine methyltransferase n=1 Tax=Streptomyces griseocarneus TaxID=51201 RepID=UPI00167C6253|nr:DNA (cytosine-5-)-methyltransferase [Streptomyces griseocarneus]MBZ6477833.1 DNA (cytosine-5-)-methyltransferase [Streptomyces griseocarneus]GHG58128.1 cytosine-specific methyltransferase [Streptomyces griseocarneus]
MSSSGTPLTSIEICAGAGGQAVGLHDAGFRHLALLEIDKHACQTLRDNVAQHPDWTGCQVVEGDVNDVDPFEHEQLVGFGLKPGELDLLAGGVPCPPFSVAGRQLGEEDERDLFPRMLQLAEQLRPKAIMIENVRGILDGKFTPYRDRIVAELVELEYEFCGWELIEARSYGVPQLRPRAILVMIDKKYMQDTKFEWPTGDEKIVTVAEALKETMWERCEPHGVKGKAIFDKWLDTATRRASEAPTLVGGSKKHGGADLGPSRAKAAWAALGVDGWGVANDLEKCIPERDLFRENGPMLTVEQAAIIQGFPRHWKFSGGKTARYRQVGNAFPPPVAEAVGRAIAAVLRPEDQTGAELVGTALVPGARGEAELSATVSDRADNLEAASV